MRVKEVRVLVLALLGFLSVAIPTHGAPSVSRIIQYHLATRSFSELHAAVVGGQYDFLDQGDLVLSILDTESGLEPLHQETLIEQVVARSTAGDTQTGMITLLAGRFESLTTPTLRARVLELADNLGVPGAAEAVLQSASRLSAELTDHGRSITIQGYEVEASALAAVAPGYPSMVLAELLRTISVHATDRRTVTATRGAARQILRQLREIPGE